MKKEEFSLYSFIKDLFRREEKPRKALSREQVEKLYNEISRHIPLESYAKEMLHGVLFFKDIVVKEIMVPRTDVVAIEENTTLDGIVEKIIEKGFSRMPVYRERIDDIVGVVYAKDLFKYWKSSENIRAADIMRDAYFVPETKKIVDLLKEFRDRKTHIAIVVDEYGGVSGIVTLEDILEEIVGDIRDEYDKAEEEKIVKIDDNTYMVDPKVDLDLFSEYFDVDLYDESCETLGGFLYSKFGEVPKEGDEIRVGKLIIKVEKSNPKKIEKLRVYVEENTDS